MIHRSMHERLTNVNTKGFVNTGLGLPGPDLTLFNTVMDLPQYALHSNLFDPDKRPVWVKEVTMALKRYLGQERDIELDAAAAAEIAAAASAAAAAAPSASSSQAQNQRSAAPQPQKQPPPPPPQKKPSAPSSTPPKQRSMLYRSAAGFLGLTGFVLKNTAKGVYHATKYAGSKLLNELIPPGSHDPLVPPGEPRRAKRRDRRMQWLAVIASV